MCITTRYYCKFYATNCAVWHHIISYYTEPHQNKQIVAGKTGALAMFGAITRAIFKTMDALSLHLRVLRCFVIASQLQQ